MTASKEAESIPTLLDTERASTDQRKNWARLIQKLYEVGPLALIGRSLFELHELVKLGFCEARQIST
jgi:hypothetical protein